MQGLVTIDFGNSHPHAGIFQKHGNQWDLVKVVPWNETSIYLNQLGINSSNSSLVLCEVKAREEELQPLQEQGFLLTRVKDYWRGTRFAGMPVHYAKTLGEDRLIQAFYCYKKLKENILLIDAGTFATMDVVTTTGFQGGYIIPGFSQYFSLFQKGEQLKSFEFNQNIQNSLPQGTLEAMRDSYSAFAALAHKLIKEHNIQKILLTGGLGEVWKGLFADLRPSVHVQLEPTLIHWALQYWMTTQIEPL